MMPTFAQPTGSLIVRGYHPLSLDDCVELQEIAADYAKRDA
jgi:hypothetical protein